MEWEYVDLPIIHVKKQRITSVYNQGEQGFYLFEVLIAMVIMSIGMLGVAAMLMVSHKASSSSYLRQQAVQSAYNIIDRMRANRQAAINGSYNASDLVNSGTPTLPSTPAANCATTTCTSTQMATYDVWYWLTYDVAQLPNGAGSISTAVSGSNTIATVVVQWSDVPAQNMLGAGGAVSSTNATIAQFSIGTSL